MLSPTVIKTGDPTGYLYIEEISCLKYISLFGFSNSSLFYANSTKDNEDFLYLKDLKNNINFISEKKKIIVSITQPFFHFYIDTFSAFLKKYNEDKDIEVIIVDDENHNGESSFLNESYIKMFFTFLEDNNLKYYYYYRKQLHGALINNFYLFTGDDLNNNSGKRLFEMAQRYIYDNDNNNKKIYIKSGRVKEEKLLEEYLKKYNFEIYEYENFDNFIDQINYFYNSKIIFGATCGGFVNMCFMKEGSTIIELVTPIPQHGLVEGEDYDILDPFKSKWTGDEIHNIYNILSLKKNHMYIALSNIDKTASDIIYLIEQNENLKRTLAE